MLLKIPDVITRASKKANFHWRSVQPRRLPKLNHQGHHIISQLTHQGVCTTTLDNLAISGTTEMLLTTDQLLEELPKSNSLACQGERSTASHSVGLSAGQLIDYPSLFMWGLQSRWLDLIENYLNQPPAYLGCVLRREVPNHKQVGVRLWHKDGEDYKVVKVIVYLNNVGEEEGPFEYIPQKHSPNYSQFSHVNNTVRDLDMAQVIPTDTWQRCLGPRGTVVIADTASVFHHASLPQHDRYSVTFAYVSTASVRDKSLKHNEERGLMS
ncbi:MAG: hypothetical protein F6K11_06320 [Leptolyngbya sp. SIO3F4]|nr:hypothetical protein [Leptolyngbya sp. SIO3F4]